MKTRVTLLLGAACSAILFSSSALAQSAYSALQLDSGSFFTMNNSGQLLGTVVNLPNYGAGDLLEIAPASGSTILVPFTEAVVPEIDVAAGRIVIDPPRGLFGDEDGEEVEGGEA
jgi:hypothetical protein